MRSPSRATTLTAVTTPMVLTIGCGAPLRDAAARATSNLGAVLKHCEMAQAPNAVAQQRPLAILIPQDLYEFDPVEFDALARDVSACLVRVEDDIAVEMLEPLLGAAIDAALARRRKQGAVIVTPDDPRAAPPSWRKGARRQRASSSDADAPPSSHGASRA